MSGCKLNEMKEARKEGRKEYRKIICTRDFLNFQLGGVWSLRNRSRVHVILLPTKQPVRKKKRKKQCFGFELDISVFSIRKVYKILFFSHTFSTFVNKK